MLRTRMLTFIALGVLAAGAVFVALRVFGPALAQVKAIPRGHQEIAWIAPATSGEGWERLVAAVKQLQKDWSKLDAGRVLQIDLERAFLDLTADVPELALYFEGAEQSKLWIRWYKLSGENDIRAWTQMLSRRGQPPLAIIGGDTSDRALAFAEALKAGRDGWRAPAPLFCITTATAERYYPRDMQGGEKPHKDLPELMKVYPERSFRFSFTNTRMVEALRDFIKEHPQVWTPVNAEPEVFASAVAQAEPWGALGGLAAAGHLKAKFLCSWAWFDDAYSKDLEKIFWDVFGNNIYNGIVQYSVGDYYQPNPQEEVAVNLYLASNDRFKDDHQLFVLPTNAQRARRFLRTIFRRAPEEVRNIVVVTGDSISFNNIYRDRDVAWNIQDMPVPLVFFSHRNPISTTAGFGQKDPATGLVSVTGTQDLLLQRDIVEGLVLAAFDGKKLVADADRLLDRLRQTRWQAGRLRAPEYADKDGKQSVPFFDEAGNRRPSTGEHIVWLKPEFEKKRILSQATITVWRSQLRDNEQVWRLVDRPLEVRYDRPRQEGHNIHAGE